VSRAQGCAGATLALYHHKRTLHAVQLIFLGLTEMVNLENDLRDAWEHKLHNSERKVLVKALFKLVRSGTKVSILSGDVHTSSVFRMKDDKGSLIYQLTSSAITYNLP
jgi:hypothetical protein